MMMMTRHLLEKAFRAQCPVFLILLVMAEAGPLLGPSKGPRCNGIFERHLEWYADHLDDVESCLRTDGDPLLRQAAMTSWDLTSGPRKVVLFRYLNRLLMERGLRVPHDDVGGEEAVLSQFYPQMTLGQRQHFLQGNRSKIQGLTPPEAVPLALMLHGDPSLEEAHPGFKLTLTQHDEVAKRFYYDNVSQEGADDDVEDRNEYEDVPATQELLRKKFDDAASPEASLGLIFGFLRDLQLQMETRKISDKQRETLRRARKALRGVEMDDEGTVGDVLDLGEPMALLEDVSGLYKMHLDSIRCGPHFSGLVDRSKEVTSKLVSLIGDTRTWDRDSVDLVGPLLTCVEISALALIDKEEFSAGLTSLMKDLNVFALKTGRPLEDCYGAEFTKRLRTLQDEFPGVRSSRPKRGLPADEDFSKVIFMGTEDGAQDESLRMYLDNHREQPPYGGPRFNDGLPDQRCNFSDHKFLSTLYFNLSNMVWSQLGGPVSPDSGPDLANREELDKLLSDMRRTSKLILAGILDLDSQEPYEALYEAAMQMLKDGVPIETRVRLRDALSAMHLRGIKELVRLGDLTPDDLGTDCNFLAPDLRVIFPDQVVDQAIARIDGIQLYDLDYLLNNEPTFTETPDWANPGFYQGPCDGSCLVDVLKSGSNASSSVLLGRVQLTWWTKVIGELYLQSVQALLEKERFKKMSQASIMALKNDLVEEHRLHLDKIRALFNVSAEAPDFRVTKLAGEELSKESYKSQNRTTLDQELLAHQYRLAKMIIRHLRMKPSDFFLPLDRHMISSHVYSDMFSMKTEESGTGVQMLLEKEDTVPGFQTLIFDGHDLSTMNQDNSQKNQSESSPIGIGGDGLNSLDPVKFQFRMMTGISPASMDSSTIMSISPIADETEMNGQNQLSTSEIPSAADSVNQSKTSSLAVEYSEQTSSKIPKMEVTSMGGDGFNSQSPLKFQFGTMDDTSPAPLNSSTIMSTTAINTETDMTSHTKVLTSEIPSISDSAVVNGLKSSSKTVDLNEDPTPNIPSQEASSMGVNGFKPVDPLKFQFGTMRDASSASVDNSTIISTTMIATETEMTRQNKLSTSAKPSSSDSVVANQSTTSSRAIDYSEQTSPKILSQEATSMGWDGFTPVDSLKFQFGTMEDASPVSMDSSTIMSSSTISTKTEMTSHNQPSTSAIPLTSDSAITNHSTIGSITVDHTEQTTPKIPSKDASNMGVGATSIGVNGFNSVDPLKLHLGTMGHASPASVDSSTIFSISTTATKVELTSQNQPSTSAIPSTSDSVVANQSTTSSIAVEFTEKTSPKIPNQEATSMGVNEFNSLDPLRFHFGMMGDTSSASVDSSTILSTTTIATKTEKTSPFHLSTSEIPSTSDSVVVKQATSSSLALDYTAQTSSKIPSQEATSMGGDGFHSGDPLRFQFGTMADTSPASLKSSTIMSTSTIASGNNATEFPDFQPLNLDDIDLTSKNQDNSQYNQTESAAMGIGSDGFHSIDPLKFQFRTIDDTSPATVDSSTPVSTAMIANGTEMTSLNQISTSEIPSTSDLVVMHELTTSSKAVDYSVQMSTKVPSQEVTNTGGDGMNAVGPLDSFKFGTIYSTSPPHWNTSMVSFTSTMATSSDMTGVNKISSSSEIPSPSDPAVLIESTTSSETVHHTKQTSASSNLSKTNPNMDIDENTTAQGQEKANTRSYGDGMLMFDLITTRNGLTMVPMVPMDPITVKYDLNSARDDPSAGKDDLFSSKYGPDTVKYDDLNTAKDNLYTPKNGLSTTKDDLVTGKNDLVTAVFDLHTAKDGFVTTNDVTAKPDLPKAKDNNVQQEKLSITSMSVRYILLCTLKVWSSNGTCQENPFLLQEGLQLLKELLGPSKVDSGTGPFSQNSDDTDIVETITNTIKAIHTGVVAAIKASGLWNQKLDELISLEKSKILASESTADPQRVPDDTYYLKEMLDLTKSIVAETRMQPRDLTASFGDYKSSSSDTLNGTSKTAHILKYVFEDYLVKQSLRNGQELIGVFCNLRMVDSKDLQCLNGGPAPPKDSESTRGVEGQIVRIYDRLMALAEGLLQAVKAPRVGLSKESGTLSKAQMTRLAEVVGGACTMGCEALKLVVVLPPLGQPPVPASAKCLSDQDEVHLAGVLSQFQAAQERPAAFNSLAKQIRLMVAGGVATMLRLDPAWATRDEKAEELDPEVLRTVFRWYFEDMRNRTASEITEVNSLYNWAKHILQQRSSSGSLTSVQVQKANELIDQVNEYSLSIMRTFLGPGLTPPSDSETPLMADPAEMRRAVDLVKNNVTDEMREMLLNYTLGQKLHIVKQLVTILDLNSDDFDVSLLSRIPALQQKYIFEEGPNLGRNSSSWGLTLLANSSSSGFRTKRSTFLPLPDISRPPGRATSKPAVSLELMNIVLILHHQVVKMAGRMATSSSNLGTEVEADKVKFVLENQGTQLFERIKGAFGHADSNNSSVPDLPKGSRPFSLVVLPGPLDPELRDKLDVAVVQHLLKVTKQLVTLLHLTPAQFRLDVDLAVMASGLMYYLFGARAWSGSSDRHWHGANVLYKEARKVLAAQASEGLLDARQADLAKRAIYQLNEESVEAVANLLKVGANSVDAMVPEEFVELVRTRRREGTIDPEAEVKVKDVVYFKKLGATKELVRLLRLTPDDLQVPPEVPKDLGQLVFSSEGQVEDISLLGEIRVEDLRFQSTVLDRMSPKRVPRVSVGDLNANRDQGLMAEPKNGDIFCGSCFRKVYAKWLMVQGLINQPAYLGLTGPLNRVQYPRVKAKEVDLFLEALADIKEDPLPGLGASAPPSIRTSGNPRNVFRQDPAVVPQVDVALVWHLYQMAMEKVYGHLSDVRTIGSRKLVQRRLASLIAGQRQRLVEEVQQTVDGDFSTSEEPYGILLYGTDVSPSTIDKVMADFLSTVVKQIVQLLQLTRQDFSPLPDIEADAVNGVLSKIFGG